MNRSTLTLKRIGTVAAYLALGIVGTAAVALGLLYTLQPVQQVVYDVFYLQMGPSEATETAILTHFLLAGFTAISTVLIVGDYLSTRLTHWTGVANAIAVLGGFVLAFLVVALLEEAAFLTAILVLTAAVLTVPLLLWYRYDVRSGGIPAFIGGIPVLIFLLLLAGFGLGWGWGYIMTAQEVPASAVNGSTVDFDAVPQVRDDLFAGDCSTGPDGRRVCRLYLRGYEYEVRAARFMARHGARCPYQNADAGEADTFIAQYNETYYRVSCSPHGD